MSLYQQKMTYEMISMSGKLPNLFEIAIFTIIINHNLGIRVSIKLVSQIWHLTNIFLL
jgi:ABC-type amino acid transport system permease subunit